MVIYLRTYQLVMEHLRTRLKLFGVSLSESLNLQITKDSVRDGTSYFRIIVLGLKSIQRAEG